MGSENKSKNEVCQDKKTYGFGVRHIQSLILFIGISLAYAVRVNLNIAIVAMTDKRTGNPNFKIFDWDIKVKSLVLSSFYWGYVVNQVPAGKLSKLYGSKLPILFGILVSSVLTMITPITTELGNWQALVVLRFFEGLAQGMIFPSLHTYLAQWVPVEERPRLGMFAYSGVNFGTALILAISGTIATSILGWPGIFYLSGSCGILWCIVWFVFGANNPAQHRSISNEEREFIEKSLGVSKDSHKIPIPIPWIKILTSKAFLALLIAVITNAWGFLVLLIEMPTYMHAVLEVNLKNNAIMSSLPYFAMWLLGYVFVFVDDFLYEKGLMSIGGLRKLFNSIGTFVPALAIIGLAYVTKENTMIAVIVLVLAVGMNSAVGIGCALNHIDLAPNHAGIMMGLTNGAAGIVNITAPLIVGVIVTDEHNPSEWQTVFFITSAIFIMGNIVFMIFASGEQQEYNDPIQGKKIPSRNHRRSSAFVEAGPCTY